MSLRRSLFVVSLVSSIPFLYSQNLESGSGTTTFKSKVDLVLVDVTVTDKNGQPLKGLQKDDFEVFEEGKRQTVASFEEHQADPASSVVQVTPLPPRFYSNAPTVQASGAVNVLLIDSLNTEFADQASVRLQTIKYLKTVELGPRTALFTLGSNLRLIEGFNSDPKLLLDALNRKNWGAKPQTPMLRTSAENNMEQSMLNSMQGGGTNPGAPAAAIESFRDFLAEEQGTEATVRMSLTLKALQELSRYLTGYKGRKNIIWFSGSFPLNIFPSGGERTRVYVNEGGLSDEIRQTVAMLAAAQVALYPVAAQGLATQEMYQAQNLSPSGSGRTIAERAITGQNQALQQESVGRYYNQKAAEDLASNTGGRAFYNTNGLKEVIAEVVHKGAYYYRISYSPTNKRMAGSYRTIKVKIKKGPHPTPSNISFRHGYFEEDGRKQKAASEPTDLLQPMMGRGLPEATQVVYNLRLARSKVQPAPTAELMGDKKDLRRPVTRFSADFVIPVDNLNYEITPDGVRHGNVELGLVAYDHGGQPLNWIVRSMRTALNANTYPAVHDTGIRFHEEIDVPDGEDLYLRSGVYDFQSNQAGTIEIPLSEVTSTEDYVAPVQQAVTPPQASTPGATSTAVNANGTNPVPARSDEQASMLPARPIPPITLPNIPAASKELEMPEIPGYCAGVAGSVEHSDALAKVCEFALAMRKKLPDVIGEKEVKRYWTARASGWGVTAPWREAKHADVVTAKIRYQGRSEEYEDVRIDGAPVGALPWWSGAWSFGELGSVLGAIFTPSSKADFHFAREETFHSIPSVVFEYHVAAQNNGSFYLSSGNTLWFPEYRGRLWISREASQLIRLERETGYMPQYPIRQMKTQIDYSNIALGDGSRLPLPTHSDVLVCSPPLDNRQDNCARNIIKFGNWHRFRATTKVVSNPADGLPEGGPKPRP